jgi:MFS family permease
MPSNLSKGITGRLYVLAFMAGTSVGLWYFLPYFILDLQGGLIEVGLISTVPTLVAALVQLSVGSILDETKATKNILVLGFILSSVFAMPFLFASTALVVILMAMVTEIFNSITIIWGVANSIYMADLTPSKRRAGIMSGYSSSWYLGNIVGYFLAGLLAPIDWRTVFIVFAGVNLVAGLFLKYCLPEGTLHVKDTSYGTIIHALFKTRNFLTALKRLPTLIKASPKAFASFCLAISIRSIGVSMVMPLTAFYLAEALHASKPMIATLTAVGAVARILTAPPMGWVADKWGRKNVFLIGLITMMVYPIIFVSAQDVTVLYLSYVMMGVGWACNQATYLAWQMELVPQEKGRFIGLLNFMNNLSWGIGPLMGGLIGEYAGLWWGVGAATLAELVGFLLLKKVPEKASDG